MACASEPDPGSVRQNAATTSPEAQRVSQRIYCFQEGRVSLQGASDELTREQISEVWGVEASLEVSEDERTALHVSWLDSRDD